MPDKIIDISFSNKLMPKKGRILLSDPFLGDEYFERSVVYLCEHNEEGSFGFVLNNEIELTLQQLNENFKNISCKISIGGPVEKESMYFMHTMGNQIHDSLIIDKDISMGGDFNQLYDLVNDEIINEGKIKFFIGYSGWSKGQLMKEIKDHAWIVAEIENSDEIMKNKTGNLWKYFMNKQGEKYKIMSNFPIDPSEN